MMKIIITSRLILLTFLFLILLSANCISQSVRRKDISITCDNKPLRSVLEDIRIQAGVNFIYYDDLIDNKKVTCKIKNSEVKDAVRKVLSGFSISYKEFGENAFVLYEEIRPVKTSYKAIVVDQNTTISNIVVSFIKPEVVSGNKPVYPAEAVKNNIEGNVQLRFLIDNTGKVQRVVIEKSSGSEILDSAATDYINKLIFSPAKENGIQRSIWMSMVLKYLVVAY
jgi:TonB family protein